MRAESLPEMIVVRQSFPDRHLPDIPSAVRRQMEASGFASQLAPGASVGIGVGSRGVANIAIIVKSVVDYWVAHGFRPFLFPAMGSHGAATAQGQKDVLARYGIDEAAMGCPIESSLEVVSLGATPEGFPTFAGVDAWSADAVMLINRVKWHTSFRGANESGLVKMMAIGLGKMECARSSHQAAWRHGMETVIQAIGKHVLDTGKLIGGLAILEDAHHQTAHVEALPARNLISREAELLTLTKSWMAGLPITDVDVLIVDEIGKNIAGTGMDAKIINRGLAADSSPDAMRIATIFVRDITKASYGSAVGTGMADVIHSRIKQKMDVNAGLVNAMTTGSLMQIRLPVDFPTDLECLDVCIRTANPDQPENARIVWIQNTLELNQVAVSVNAAGGLQTIGEPFRLPFESDGNLPHLNAYLESRMTAPLPAI